MGELVVEVSIELGYRSESEVPLLRLEVCVVEESLPTAQQYDANCQDVKKIVRWVQLEIWEKRAGVCPILNFAHISSRFSQWF